MWNSLSNHVVRAESTNTFKTRLDKFWGNQNIFYDYCAKIINSRNWKPKCNELVIV